MSKSRESYNLLLNKIVTVDNPFNLEATQVQIKNLLTNKQTYSASILNLVVASTPTDILTIQGSETKIIKIHSIEINAIKNKNASIDILFLLRSSANTGGASIAITPAKLDSLNSAATAIITQYTTNPSALGTLVSRIKAIKYWINGASTSPIVDSLSEYKFEQPITLRGVNEYFCINLNATTTAMAGNLFNITINFTEE